MIFKSIILYLIAGAGFMFIFLNTWIYTEHIQNHKCLRFWICVFICFLLWPLIILMCGIVFIMILFMLLLGYILYGKKENE